MVLIKPVGYTRIFSLLEKITLAIPKTTAMNSSQVVLLMPVINCSKISCTMVIEDAY